MTSNKSPRILHLIDVGGTGGAETVFCQLVAYFAGVGQNACTVVPSRGWITRQLEASGLPVALLPSRGSMSWRVLQGIAFHCRRSRANIILAHLIGSSVYASLAGMLLGIPVVSVFHGAWDVHEPGRLSWLKKWLLQRAHVRIVAVSDAVKSALVNWGISAERIAVIQNGVDTEKFRPVTSRPLRAELSVGRDTILVGAVGNLHPVKGYELLLRAAARLTESKNDWQFFVAGEGEETYLQTLRELRDLLGLRRKFHFLGYRAASSELYCSMDAFLSTAQSEGLPLSFLEAMACEVPIVATRNLGSVALLESTKGGVIAEGDGTDSLVEKLESVATNASYRESIGRKGREAVCRNFSLAEMFSRYRILVEQLVSDWK